MVVRSPYHGCDVRSPKSHFGRTSRWTVFISSNHLRKRDPFDLNTLIVQKELDDTSQIDVTAKALNRETVGVLIGADIHSSSCFIFELADVQNVTICDMNRLDSPQSSCMRSANKYER